MTGTAVLEKGKHQSEKEVEYISDYNVNKRKESLMDKGFIWTRLQNQYAKGGVNLLETADNAQLFSMNEEKLMTELKTNQNLGPDSKTGAVMDIDMIIQKATNVPNLDMCKAHCLSKHQCNTIIYDKINKQCNMYTYQSQLDQMSGDGSVHFLDIGIPEEYTTFKGQIWQLRDKDISTSKGWNVTPNARYCAGGSLDYGDDGDQSCIGTRIGTICPQQNQQNGTRPVPINMNIHGYKNCSELELASGALGIKTLDLESCKNDSNSVVTAPVLMCGRMCYAQNEQGKDQVMIPALRGSSNELNVGDQSWDPIYQSADAFVNDNKYARVTFTADDKCQDIEDRATDKWKAAGVLYGVSGKDYENVNDVRQFSCGGGKGPEAAIKAFSWPPSTLGQPKTAFVCPTVPYK